MVSEKHKRDYEEHKQKIKNMSNSFISKYYKQIVNVQKENE